MNSGSTNFKNNSIEFENEIKKYYCVIEWCRQGPFSKLELRRHYENQNHYSCALARALAIITCKLQDLKEAQQ